MKKVFWGQSARWGQMVLMWNRYDENRKVTEFSNMEVLGDLENNILCKTFEQQKQYSVYGNGGPGN